MYLRVGRLGLLAELDTMKLQKDRNLGLVKRARRRQPAHRHRAEHRCRRDQQRRGDSP